LKTAIVILLLSIVFIKGCTYEEEEELKPWARFHIKISGFEIEPEDYKVPNPALVLPFDSFSHKYAPAKIYFEVNKYVRHTVYTANKDINKYLVKLPVGTYTVFGGDIKYNWYFGAKMGYYINKQEITIIDTTTVINLKVSPKCGLLLIVDVDSSIERCYIKNPNFSYPFINEGDLYYIYFKSSSNTYAYFEMVNDTIYCISTSFFQDDGYINKLISTNLEALTACYLK
jgi:hypothetical protein